MPSRPSGKTALPNLANLSHLFEEAARPHLLHSIISPDVKILIIIPGSADNIEVSVIVQVSEAGAEVALLPAVSDVFSESACAVVFENLQLELALGSLVFTSDNVVIAIPVQVGDIKVVERIFSDDYVSPPR